MTTPEKPPTISPLQRALDELERKAGTAAHLIRHLSGFRPTSDDGTDEQAAERLERAFEGVKAEVAKLLPPPALSSKAADLLSTYPWKNSDASTGAPFAGEAAAWMANVHTLLAELAAGRLAEAIRVDEAQKAARIGVDVEARRAITELVQVADRDVRRYQRLRIIGVAPSSTKQLENRTVLCFQNLDDYVDADLRAHPSRGEHPADLDAIEVIKTRLESAAIESAIAEDVRLGRTYTEIQNEIIQRVGMMASARTPVMQARLDAAIKRDGVRDQPWVAAIKADLGKPLERRDGMDWPKSLAAVEQRLNAAINATGPGARAGARPLLWRELQLIHNGVYWMLSSGSELAEKLFHAFWDPLVQTGCPMPNTWDKLHETQRKAWRCVAATARADAQLERGAQRLRDDRADSGMAPDERGTPFSMDEIEMVLRSHNMNPYHRDAMRFLVRRVKRLSEVRVDVPLTAPIPKLADTIAPISDDLAASVWRAAVASAAEAPVPLETRMTSKGERPRHIYDAADRSRYCKWCGEEECHPVHIARPAEIVYEAPAAPLVPGQPDQVATEQEAIRNADDEMRRALMALRTEVPESVADEMTKRYNAVVNAYRRHLSLPSHELVALRHFHDNVTAAVREAVERNALAMYPAWPGIHRLQQLATDVRTNGGQTLMVPLPAPDGRK